MGETASEGPRVPAAIARRLLLQGQGLLGTPPPATAARVYELVEAMGFVQIDSINVVERAHHLILGARLRGYRPSLLSRLLEKDRLLFEHWTHDAAAIPTVWFPYWRHRFERYRAEVPRRPWWSVRMGAHPERVVARVRDRLAREGPLASRHFERVDARASGEEGGDSSGWWGWKPEKAALEYLWRIGEVAIAGRDGFHKLYDLTERVLPQAAAAPPPASSEHLDWACRTALERLGIASAEEIAAFWQAVPASAARAWCVRAVAAGAAVRVTVEAVDGSAPRAAFALPDWEARAAAASPPPGRVRLLSPFDPILRDRRRCLRLFGFDFRFEGFVPAGQRRHGYYVMPILAGERLIGRLDPKLDREAGRLVVRGLWWEPGPRRGGTAGRPSRRRRQALAAALERLARSLGADSWSLPEEPEE